MLSEQLKVLLAIQEIDTKRLKLARQQKETQRQDEVNRLTQEIKLLQAELDDKRQAQQAAEKEIRRQEQLLAGWDDTLAKGEQRLYDGSVTNTKELEKMQRQLAVDRQKRDRCEEKILEMLVQVETLAQGIKEVQDRVAAKETALVAAQAELETANAQLAREIAQLNVARKKLARQVDRTLLDTYVQFYHQKGGKVISRVKNDACAVCRVSLSTGLLQKVREGKELQLCENCGRILYWNANS